MKPAQANRGSACLLDAVSVASRDGCGRPRRACPPRLRHGALKNGVYALRTPVDTLLSNRAYLLMAGLLPVGGRWRVRHEAQKQEILRMHARRFINTIVRVPCQVVRSGRRVIDWLLGWNPWQSALLRMADAMRHPLRC